MTVSAIVAVSRNGYIGKDNQIPWYLSDDLKHFKRTTLDHHVIMGRKSFLSIGKPLPKRTNIVITRNPYLTIAGCIVARSILEALQVAFDNDEREVFIIGGGQIYEQSQEYWDRLYLTEVHADVDGDVKFPPLKAAEWDLMEEEFHQADRKNEFDFTIKMLERKEKNMYYFDPE